MLNELVNWSYLQLKHLKKKCHRLPNYLCDWQHGGSVTAVLAKPSTITRPAAVLTATALGQSLAVLTATAFGQSLAVLTATALGQSLAVLTATALGQSLAVLTATALRQSLAVLTATVLGQSLAVCPRPPVKRPGQCICPAAMDGSASVGSAGGGGVVNRPLGSFRWWSGNWKTSVPKNVSKCQHLRAQILEVYLKLVIKKM